MFFVNIVGQLKDIDYVVEKYIYKNNIELNNAVEEIKNNNKDIYSTKIKDEDRNNQNILNNNDFASELAFKFVNKNNDSDFSYKIEISKDYVNDKLSKQTKQKEKETKEIEELKMFKDKLIGFKKNINHFKNLELRLNKLDDLVFFYYEFGRMPIHNYKQYKSFLLDDRNIIVIKGEVDRKFVWLIYFTDVNSKKRVKNIFNNLNFERIEINLGNDNSKFSSNIQNNLSKIDDTIIDIDKKINVLKISIRNIELIEKAALSEKIFDIYSISDSKKFGAVVVKDFFIFMGWIPKNIFKDLDKKIKNDNKVILLVDENNKKNPPVLLKNHFLFKPFESLVKLYGIPDYFEIDPTPFLAITYTILFGMMFGDIGQGLVFFVTGLILSNIKKFKNNNLLKVLSILGISSMIFGYLYGSIFGFENLIKPLWIRPSDNIVFILFFSVIAGIFLIFVSMTFNLVNCIKTKNIFDLIINQNGLTGLFFYLSILSSFLLFFYKSDLKYVKYILLFACINLFLISFKELIKKIFKKQSNLFDSQNIMVYLFEKVIELIEILLNYFTNTISFVRVGAFALSHAGMMSVVMLLSEKEFGKKNWITIIFGNILVMLLEGLIVGIQVLRLEFYELFGRFFRGTGREFINNKKI
jgi:V/A-type H+-transporting ATPase subunit I